MAKRFIDTSIWTQNKWFRKLDPKYKLFWIYLICNCDQVGVWEEDFELASFIIGDEFTKDEISKIFDGQIKWMNGKKLWIIDFCNFQYGTLIEESTSNKPHQSYINQLKKHSLWIDYKRGIKGDKEKEKEKETEKGKDSLVEFETAFKSEVWQFIDQYPESLLKDFLNYWTEKSKSGKLRFQSEKYFEVSRRLATWASRDKNFNKQPEKIKPQFQYGPES